MKKILIVMAILTGLVYGQSMLNINLNEKDIEGSFDNISTISRNTRVYKTLGYLKAEDKYKNSNSMVEGELLVAGITAIPGFSVGMGIKGVASDIDEADKVIGAIALKVKAIYTLPLMVKSYVSGSYAYAPDSLTFSDLENYYETRGEANFEVIDGGIAYLGVRNIEMEFKDVKKKYTFNSSAYFGIRFILSR